MVPPHSMSSRNIAIIDETSSANTCMFLFQSLLLSASVNIETRLCPTEILLLVHTYDTASTNWHVHM